MKRLKPYLEFQPRFWVFGIAIGAPDDPYVAFELGVAIGPVTFGIEILRQLKFR